MEFLKECKRCRSNGFLVFLCQSCRFEYCQDHRFSHSCNFNGARVSSTHEANDSIIIDQVNVKEIQKSNNETRDTISSNDKSADSNNHSKGKENTECKQQGCKTRINMVSTKCLDCLKLYCINHRHSHTCITSKNNETKPRIADKKVFKSSNPRVELMRIKMNSKGNQNIPTTDRFYFKLVGNGKELLLFSDLNSKVGRVVDEYKGFLFVNETKLDPSLTFKELLDQGVLSQGCELTINSH